MLMRSQPIQGVRIVWKERGIIYGDVVEGTLVKAQPITGCWGFERGKKEHLSVCHSFIHSVCPTRIYNKICKLGFFYYTICKFFPKSGFTEQNQFLTIFVFKLYDKRRFFRSFFLLRILLLCLPKVSIQIGFYRTESVSNKFCIFFLLNRWLFRILYITIPGIQNRTSF